MTESDVLDNIMNAFVEEDFDTLEGFLERMGSDESVLMLHMAIHKYFGD